MDDERREIANGALFIRDNVIEQVGATADLPNTADEILDLTGHLFCLDWLIHITICIKP